MPDDSPPTLNQQLIQVGVSESHASMLLSGARKPSLPLRLRLQGSLGIPLLKWDEGPEAVKSAMAEAAADAARANAAANAPGCPA